MHLKKLRNIKIDFLKAVAIFLVVYGHCIQYAGNGKNNFFQDPVFIFIYSFHMPLFMMISGWVFFYSFSRKDFIEIVVDRFKQLVVPVMFWTVTFSFFVGLVKYKGHFLGTIFKVSVGDIYNGFWFLTVLFVISLAFSGIVKMLSKFQFVFLIVFWIFLLFLPDGYYFSFVKFMYPYFLLGYYSNKYKENLREIKYQVGLLSIVSMGILLFCWRGEYYIYTTGMSFYGANLPDKILIVCYRYSAGLSGIGFVFFLVSLLPGRFFESHFLRMFSAAGTNSFGIYIMTSYLFTYLIPRINFPEILVGNRFVYDFVFTLLLAALLSAICNVLIHFMTKNIFLKKYYLGGR
jgi:fucose 4-O-acetylase-like acetyltransferase